jgi:hypothetical protein
MDAVRTTDNQRIRGFAYAWDRANNRRFERHLTVDTNPSETNGTGDAYQYDSIYRLVHSDRGVADSDLDAIATNTATVTSPPVVYGQAEEYQLDAAGNRVQTTIDSKTAVYRQETGAPSLDAAMNQYPTLFIPLGAGCSSVDAKQPQAA